MKWHASTDGGASWREHDPRRSTRCQPAGVAAYLGDGVFAADPATGDLAMRTSSPVKIRPSWRTGCRRRRDLGERIRDGGRPRGQHDREQPGRRRDLECTRFRSRSSTASTTRRSLGRGAPPTGDRLRGRQGARPELHIHRSTDGGGTWAPSGPRARAGAGAADRSGRAGRRHARDGRFTGRAAGSATQHRRGRDGGARRPGPGGRAKAMPGGRLRGRLRSTGWIWLLPDGGGWTIGGRAGAEVITAQT